MKHKNRIKASPVPLIAASGIASVGTGDGRIIPALILDASSRPDIIELLRVHQHSEPGDAETQWGKSTGEKVGLIIEFIRPMKVRIDILLDIETTGFVVDQITMAQLLYIQSGSPGDVLSKNLDKPRILIEVPNFDFKENWDKIWKKSLTKQYKAKGYPKKDAQAMAIETISEWRSFGRFRLLD